MKRRRFPVVLFSVITSIPLLLDLAFTCTTFSRRLVVAGRAKKFNRHCRVILLVLAGAIEDFRTLQDLAPSHPLVEMLDDLDV